MKLSEIAEKLHLSWQGEDVEISDICSAEQPREGCIGYAEDVRTARALHQTEVACIVGPPGVEKEGGKPVLLAPQPKKALIGLLNLFRPYIFPAPGIHPTAWIAPTVRISPHCSIGAFCVVEDGAVLGENTILYPLVYVGRNCQIGARCLIFPGCVLLDGVILGNDVILHPGVVVGSEGFGFFRDEGGKVQKIPQRGTVRIHDDVEIGANTTIDRATIDSTEIGAHSKLDNLIQVGHNVVIGEASLLAAQVGISGSVRIGERATIGGQAGLKDHIQIGKNVTIAAQAGVFHNLPNNVTVSGYPALPHQFALRLLVLFQRLPELFERVKKLEEELKKK
ncbi:MAG: UDP-3-O-(3-hydroxymyristoyl)glucosamine N-acyltransferase [bacterium JZ-2024 1]